MSASHTTTTTTSSTACPLRSRPVPPPPAAPAIHKEEGLEDEDEDEILRRVQEQVPKVGERKAAEAVRKEAEEKATRAAAARRKAAQEAWERALWAQQQEEEVTERRRLLAAAATARSQRGTSPSEVSASPRRPIVEIWKMVKSKGKAKAQPVGGDPNDSNDDDDEEEERTPCEQCRSKKISCQMQAGKRSSVICKPCHDVKVRCLYSGRPSTVKRERGENPTGERLVVLESQMAQLLADNQL
ncbi:hypothetical protein F5051DRAFT_447048 [Lentinula edodes]|nr:hypothetical protein F5051DRAFT_447048 [Lentinula edodes]